MEDQHKRMEALKKVYAEIILNTAKEAGARALESERKALRFHHDLRNTKEEAFRMLIRFKQMIDVKTTEAETTALSQQKRIKELDAQLNETEGVIVDLRAEIRNAHEQLEKMKNRHMLPSNGPSENKHMHRENTDITEHYRCSSQCSESCNPAKEITSGPNVASKTIGKEPELYRNGYTHRIRAIESNMVDEKNISEEKELIVNVDEMNSGKHALFPVDAENKDIKNINGSETFCINSRVSKDQTIKTQRLPNGVRYAQSNHKLSRFGHEKLNPKDKSSRNDAKLTENNENSACTLRRSIRKRKVRRWDDISSLFKSRSSSHYKKDLVNDSVNFEETKYEDSKSLNYSVVEKHDSAAKESDGIACNTDNKYLKYTFSRRHKKVLISRSNTCSSHVLTGQVEEKSSFHHENEKPNLIEDSSSDNQNIIDIACQLISLSGERSW